MPVYDRRYRGWDGDRRPPGHAALTLARYALGELFRSRVTLVLFVLACVPPLFFGSWIYLANNLDMLAGMGIVGNFAAVDAGTFLLFLGVQTATSFLLVTFVGPAPVGCSYIAGSPNVVSCVAAALLDGASVSFAFTVQATAPAGTTLTNTVVVTADGDEQDASDKQEGIVRHG